MNFINRIKEIKNNKKKESKSIAMKIANIFRYAIPAGILLMSVPTYKHIIKDLSFSNDHFIISFVAFLVLLACNIFIFLSSKWLFEEIEDDNTKLTEKEINDFILSFPEQYHDLVTSHVASVTAKKNVVSLSAIKILEKKLTKDKLKSYSKTLYLTQFLSNNKNIIIKEKEAQNEFQK